MNEHWIAVWGCAITKPVRRTAEWTRNTTLRMQIQMPVAGNALRFRFSNLFGEQEAVITRASVSAATEGSAMDADRCCSITFDGNQAGRMAPGGDLNSDAVDFPFTAGETLVLNLYFEDFTQLTTCHRGSDAFAKRWCSDGDQTQSASLPFSNHADADGFPFIHTIEALCSQNCYSIVTFGDSITAQTWPDRLKRRLLEEGREDVAIIRKAVGGSRILREYSCDLYCHYGPRGLDRFEREVLLPGVKKVFILHGINDIIHPIKEGNPYRPITDLPTAEELIEGLKYYIDTAHAHGIAVFLAPILPFGGWRTYNEEREAIREKVNYWIYREARVEGILPFETNLLNPEDPLTLLPEYDRGDHLHPSGAGAQAMADCIPDEFI